MFVGSARLVFSARHVHSLKEKRSIVRRMVERIRARSGVSIAEVDAHDVHPKIVLGLAVVAADGPHCRRLLDEAIRTLDGDGTATLVHRDVAVEARSEHDWVSPLEALDEDDDDR